MQNGFVPYYGSHTIPWRASLRTKGAKAQLLSCGSLASSHVCCVTYREAYSEGYSYRCVLTRYQLTLYSFMNSQDVFLSKIVSQ